MVPNPSPYSGGITKMSAPSRTPPVRAFAQGLSQRITSRPESANTRLKYKETSAQATPSSK